MSVYVSRSPFLSTCNTVWKFHDVSTSQFLREIKFWDSRSAKSAIITHSEALNFDYYEFLHFLKAEIYQINKTQTPSKMAILDFYEFLHFLKAESDQINQIYRPGHPN